MTSFALICPPFASHVHSFEVLGEELVRRGHDVTFVLNAGGAAMVKSPALQVREVPARPGDPSVQRVLANAASPTGPLGLIRTISDSAAMTDQLCAGAPPLLRHNGAQVIIGDQLEPAAGLLAAALGLVHLSLACALPINHAPGVPLPFLDWPYDPSARGQYRAEVVHRVGDILSRRQSQVIRHWSAHFNIAPRRLMEDCLSPTLQIAQVVRGYDFPRPAPIPFEAVGPLRRAVEEAGTAPLPFDINPDRPLVFATMGTLQGGRLRRWQAIARACRAAGADLLIAHGGMLSPNQAARTGANFTTDFVPYRAVLRHASLCITHGGSNTVLDALACGVPLLVRPVAFDQKGNLARIVHHQVGQRMVRPWRTRALTAQINQLLSDPSYNGNAARLATEIAAAGGVQRAADLVENAVIAQPLGSSRLPSP